MIKLMCAVGSINALVAVFLGAFGAHALKPRLTPEFMKAYETGVEYHFYHALGLFAVAFVLSQIPESTPVRLSGWLMLAGIVLFSGSLYVMTLSGIRVLGVITPVGGVALIVAWALLTVGIVKA